MVYILHTQYMKPFQFILLGFILSGGLLQAQSDFRTGYVIRSVGDTLFGDIDYRSPLYMGKVCRFRTAGEQAQQFGPEEILAYRIDAGKYYLSKAINGRQVFLEYLINGKVSIYFLVDDQGEHYYVEKAGEGIMEIPYSEEIRTIEGRNYKVKSKEHTYLLLAFMNDAPELQSKIEAMEKPTHSGLIKVARDYHETVCDDEQCIIYEQRTRLLKVSVDVLGGITSYRPRSLSEYQGNIFEGGIFLSFWIPKSGDRWFIKTGFFRSRLPYQRTTIRLTTIPIHLQYVYRIGKVQPYLSAGINLINLNYQNSTTRGAYNYGLNAGVSYQLLPKLKVSANLHSSYAPHFDLGVFIDPSPALQFLSYSLMGGIGLDL